MKTDHIAAVEIQTDRLVLRAHRSSDLDDCAAMWGDPAVTRHISGAVFSRFESWGKMLRYAGLWTIVGYGYWAIEERATKRYAGDIGFADFKREIDPCYAGIPEIGWVLATSMHGRGYAAEAARAAVRWGDENIAVTRTICLIAPENSASIRVAQRSGYRQIDEIRYHDEATLVFARTMGQTA
jgi:RimJ/RimL family protein N-acetyltransferase